ncbi:hypothetical protein [Nocardia sp. NPDC019255]|uniref:hypothetical protein n=1 Tax=Nocardia sp. NPDC019255 TaxID=3154591 RepID=UPI0033C09AA7
MTGLALTPERRTQLAELLGNESRLKAEYPGVAEYLDTAPMLSGTGDAETDAAFDVDLVAGRIDLEKALYRVGGTPLEPPNVNRAFAQLVKKAGARPIRLHDLRHSCATLFTMGVEAATVQRDGVTGWTRCSSDIVVNGVVRDAKRSLR